MRGCGEEDGDVDMLKRTMTRRCAYTGVLFSGILLHRRRGQSVLSVV